MLKKNKLLLRYTLLICFFIGLTALSLYALSSLFFQGDQLFDLRIFNKKIIWILIVVFIFYIYFDALRYKYILRCYEAEVGILYLIKLSFINIFISNITPFATGGGISSIYFLRNKNIALTKTAAATTIKAIIPLIFFAIFGPLIIIFNPSFIDIFGENKIIYVIILIITYIIVIFFLVKVLRDSKIIKRVISFGIKILFFLKLIKDKEAIKVAGTTFQVIDHFLETMKVFLKSDRKDLFLSYLYSFLFLLMLFTFSAILIIDLNPDAPVFYVYLSQVVLIFVIYFIPTPGATGGAELLFIFFYSSIISKTDILTVTFTWRMLTVYVAMIIGMVLFYKEFFFNRKVETNED